MKLRFFDFEVTPDWWCCTFGDYENDTPYDESIKDTFVTVTSDMPNCRDLFVNLMKDNVCQVGYNIKKYDLIIANAVYQALTPQQICIISNMIINPKCKFDTQEHVRLQSFVYRKLNVHAYQDLLDDDIGSLKEKEAILGLSIMESNVPFDKPNLTDEEKNDIIRYNIHDVWACIYYYCKVRRPYIETKLQLGITFNIPESVCYKSTNATLAGIAFGAKKTTFVDEWESNVTLPGKIKDYIYDNLPSKLVDRVRCNPYVFNKGKASSKTVKETLFENELSFGNGGVHSVLTKNIYCESDDEWVLMNIDGASFYPSLLIYMNLLSRAIKEPDKYKEVFDVRMALKWKENKTPREIIDMASYKLALNTVFGASGNKYLALYDRYMCLACCRVGQLLLCALTNKLYKLCNGLKVIQTNTDGVLVYFRRKDLSLIEKAGKEWSDITNMQLEYEEVERTWQRDVNNYILVKKGGKVKNIGEWLMQDIYKIGYGTLGSLNFFASTKAALQYLLTGKDLAKSITENTNLHDFLAFCKKGPTFSRVVQRMSNGMEIDLHKCNRVMASKNTKLGKLYKVKMYKGNKSYTSMPRIPEHCRLMNDDVDSYDFAEIKRDLDYLWYVLYAADLLDIDWVPIGQAAKSTDLSIFRYE